MGTRWTYRIEEACTTIQILIKICFFDISILENMFSKTLFTKKAKHFRIWLVVAGTGLEPVTFGL